MRIINRLDEMTETARGWLTSGTVGYVSIMGGSALHDGHKALVQAARIGCEICVVSILVPSQPFDSHTGGTPRSRDLQFLNRAGVDVVFIPRLTDLYSSEFATYVTLIGPLATHLEAMKGAVAVREFATMMTKLFLLVRPDIAYYGQKDAQQVAVIRQLVRDLNIDVALHVLPTVRESNGLAMSSRNLKLAVPQRQTATVLYQALLKSKALIERGERNSAAIRAAIADHIATEPLVTLEYIIICHPDTFTEVQQVATGILIALGAQIGKVHLADNILWMNDGQWRV